MAGLMREPPQKFIIPDAGKRRQQSLERGGAGAVDPGLWSRLVPGSRIRYRRVRLPHGLDIAPFRGERVIRCIGVAAMVQFEPKPQPGGAASLPTLFLDGERRPHNRRLHPLANNNDLEGICAGRQDRFEPGQLSLVSAPAAGRKPDRRTFARRDGRLPKPFAPRLPMGCGQRVMKESGTKVVAHRSRIRVLERPQLSLPSLADRGRASRRDRCSLRPGTNGYGDGMIPRALDRDKTGTRWAEPMWLTFPGRKDVDFPIDGRIL